MFPSLQSYNILGNFEINKRQFLIEHWTSMLPIYPFFVFSKTGQLNNEVIKRWAIVFVVVAINQYYYGRAIAISRLSRFGNETEITNNQGYFIAMVMPLMFFWRKKPIIQYIGIAVLTAFVLLCVKRGAILVGALCLLMQLFYSVMRQKNVNTGVAFIVVVVFSILGYYYVSNLLSTNDFFAYRVEQTLEGDESGRSIIYSKLYQFFISLSNPITWLFGMGADGTVLILQQQAHNDWLEILIDMGVLGFMVFLVFWIRAFIDYKRFVDKDLKHLFLMVIMMLFVRTFFSMSINDISISTNIILGYCLANKYNDFKDNNIYVETENSI